MKRLFITSENLKQLIKILKKDCDEFIAPKRERLNDIIFGDAKNDDKELLDYESNSVISPRAFLLPQTEELFEIKSARDSNLVPIECKKKRIFYGVRPCDIKAITLMRDFFTDEPRSFFKDEGEYKKGRGKFVDAFYKQKIERSTFIAIACLRRCSKKSFCYEMDSGPVAKDGFDIGLTPVSTGYLADIGSKKGSRILKKNKKLFTKAPAKAIKEANDILKGFGKEVERIDHKKLAKIMAQDRVKQSIWDDIGLRCVVCSGCITLCPTCSCFSFMDRLGNDRGVRLRYCDGCIYACFTRMAGGSTPFPMH